MGLVRFSLFSVKVAPLLSTPTAFPQGWKLSAVGEPQLPSTEMNKSVSKLGVVDRVRCWCMDFMAFCGFRLRETNLGRFEEPKNLSSSWIKWWLGGGAEQN